MTSQITTKWTLYTGCVDAHSEHQCLIYYTYRSYSDALRYVCVNVPSDHTVFRMSHRITVAVETITPDLLIRVWQELDYRLDMCRVTKGAHIKHM